MAEELEPTRESPGVRSAEQTYHLRFLEDIGYHPALRLGSYRHRDTFMPTVDMGEREGNLVIVADLPGVDQNDITIEITKNDFLIIAGERRPPEHLEKIDFSERSYGPFSRKIQLGESVKADMAQASFHNGVLEITVPIQESRRTSITVTKGPTPKHKAIRFVSTPPNLLETIADAHPDLRPALERVGEWVQSHPGQNSINTRELSAELRDIDIEMLGGAISVLVKGGFFRQTYAVLTPAGVVPHLEFHDPLEIISYIRNGQLHPSFKTSDADVVVMLKAIA